VNARALRSRKFLRARVPLDLAAELRQVVDELQGAYGNYGLKEGIVVGHLCRRSAHELRAHTMLQQNFRDVCCKWMRVDAVKVVGPFCQLGKENATAVADFQ
jgi:hypothetical protein